MHRVPGGADNPAVGGEAAAVADAGDNVEGITLAPQAGDRDIIAGAHRASRGYCLTPIDESKPHEEGVSCQP
jgi:hypothetical protein